MARTQIYVLIRQAFGAVLLSERPGFLDVDFRTISPETSARRPLVIAFKVKGQATGAWDVDEIQVSTRAAIVALRGRSRSIELRSPVVRATSQSQVPTHGHGSFNPIASGMLSERLPGLCIRAARDIRHHGYGTFAANIHSAFHIRRNVPTIDDAATNALAAQRAAGSLCIAGDLVITRVEIIRARDIHRRYARSGPRIVPSGVIDLHTGVRQSDTPKLLTFTHAVTFLEAADREAGVSWTCASQLPRLCGCTDGHGTESTTPPTATAHTPGQARYSARAPEAGRRRTHGTEQSPRSRASIHRRPPDIADVANAYASSSLHGEIGDWDTCRRRPGTRACGRPSYEVVRAAVLASWCARRSRRGNTVWGLKHQVV